MFLRFSFRILIALAIATGSFQLAWAETGKTSWVNNDDMLLFYEALVKIREKSLKPESSRQIIHKAIRAYLRQQNLFADYLPPEEYKAFKRSQSDNYAGVGMDIFRDRSGKVFCVPFPRGPADKSGLRYGDTLSFINGRTVEGLSIFAMGTLIRGKEGTSVSLSIKTPRGSVKQVSLVRRRVHFPSVLLRKSDGKRVVKIFRFNKKTAVELREVLEILGPGKAIIIDLRGNIGGDFYAAMEAASLFLDSGLKIVDFKDRKGITPHLATKKPVDSSSRLILWQDRLTASAAEVFTAALVQNNRAVSIGVRSFGKGVAQRIVELSDGSALFVTDGALRSPDKNFFHLRGLDPTYPIKPNPSSADKAYLAKTREILK